jgi:hypothetical protein
MKMKGMMAVLTLGLLFAQWPAEAAPPWARPGAQDGDRHGPPGQGFQHRDAQRERRAAPEREYGRRERLTEEERRELRRDVDRANREIYRRRFER